MAAKAQGRARRWSGRKGVKLGLLGTGAGAAALLLAACGPGSGGLSVSNVVSLDGTASGQTLATLVLRWSGATFDGGPASTSFGLTFVDATGPGTVTLTRAADTGIEPYVRGTGTVGAPCVVTSNPSILVCSSLGDDQGPATFVFHGLKVDSVNGVGNLDAIAAVPATTAGLLDQKVVVARFDPPLTSPPVFVTPPSGSPGTAGGASAGGADVTATFSAGEHGSTWIRVHGPQVFLSLVGAPSWLTIGTHSGLLSGTPPAGTSGTYTFTVVADTTAHPTRPHSGNLESKETVAVRVQAP